MTADLDGVQSRAAFAPPWDAEDAFLLNCAAATPGSGAVLQLTSRGDADREWAEATWRSLRFQG